MTSRDIRRQFLDFFASKEHKIIPSAPIVAKSDPTLLFINSGMAPLKDFFLGNQKPPAPRVADTQKCLRVSGKHNDLEDVGFDGYHHTMFEMLGNWSFGDYFKKDALAWSWELLTEVYKIPKDRLYVSVFKGDEKEKLPFDQEAFDTWKQFLPEDRILPFGKKENFWEMGDQGPCGPCSEIHVDLRPDAERAKVDGRDLVNNDDPNVIEIWNNVFMEFNRKADGSLEELPAKSVDTGMGFERLCRAVQGVASNYDTDLWQPLFSFLESVSGIKYEGTYPLTPQAAASGDWKKSDVAMRVVADHLRAVSFTIADGQLPDNTGAGYVIRRILRRAVRYYYSFLGQKDPVLYRMVPILAEEFRDVFPELKAQVDFVSRVVLEEEKGFLRTLESGLKRIESLNTRNNTVSGQQAFELYDTFGFPIDLTRLIAREKGLEVDEPGFEKALQEQKDRSRKDAVKEVSDWAVLRDESDLLFLGYDQLETHSSYITKYRTVKVKEQLQFQIVLDRTPFYPEGGGQVGDKGFIFLEKEKIRVLDTKKENNLVIHVVERLPSKMDDEPIACRVDEPKRRLTEANHSATHLLHAALRQVLGTHVQQKGSYLDDETLRFDFQHFQKMTDEEITRVEQIVNEKIRENIALEEARQLPIEEAKKAGAMMLFGEKYGETVRMITFDPAFSRELCGGCHVQRTGQIGFFKITAEGAVAAGVRRVEAVTAAGAENLISDKITQYNKLKQVLKTDDVVKALNKLFEESKRLEKQLEVLYQWKASRFLEDLKGQYEEYNDVNLLRQKVELNDANVLKTLAYNLESAIKDAVIILAAENEDKIQILVRISDNLVNERGLHAGRMVQELTKTYLNGGGGGQPGFATGSGTNKANLDAALLAVQEYVPEISKSVTSPASEIRFALDVPVSDFTKNLMEQFAQKPFREHHVHPAWQYFVGKSTEYQRKVILKQGRADFTQAFKDNATGFSLQPFELVDMYCYYYMQFHYSSSLALLTGMRTVLQKYFINEKDLLFLDIGCGPMTSGAALVEFFNQSKSESPLRMFYLGFDHSEDMLERAQEVAKAVQPFVAESHFEFVADERSIFEYIDNFKQHYQRNERSAVLINLCYVMAGEWFDVTENIDKFAQSILEIGKQFDGQTVSILYQNPVHEPLNRNWERLKTRLADLGNRHKRAGVFNFSFVDVVGSWLPKWPKPNRDTRFELFFNETV